MKFFVSFLGFNSVEGGEFEIYPSSNEFDIGFIDLYTLETSFNNISFQTKFNENIFKYYPSHNNDVWQLATGINYSRTGDVKLVGTPLTVGTELWIEQERIKITNVIGVNLYDIERGVNGSIPVSHFYSNDCVLDNSIPITFATNKRLTPLGIICEFYTTDNIKGSKKLLGYGQIENITLSDNRVITVECKQLYKLLENPMLFEYSTLNEVIGLSSILYPEYSSVTNEFLMLTDIGEWMEDDFQIDCKFYSESTQNTRTIELSKTFNQFLQINNSYIKFDSVTGRYQTLKLELPTILDPSAEHVYVSSYINIQDSQIELKPFQRISTLEAKFKTVSFNPSEPDSLVFEDITHIKKDDIIGIVSNKKLEFDMTSLYFPRGIADINVVDRLLYNKIYFLNQIYDLLTITTTRWSRKFEIGKRYIFTDNHIIKSLVDQIGLTEWICLGYEDNKCLMYSCESYNRYLVSLYRNITWNSADSKWETIVTQKINESTNTLSTNDIVQIYTYDTVSDSWSDTTKTITTVVYSTNKFQFSMSGVSTSSQYMHYISYSRGVPTGTYASFLFENHGTI